MGPDQPAVRIYAGEQNEFLYLHWGDLLLWISDWDSTQSWWIKIESLDFPLYLRPGDHMNVFMRSWCYPRNTHTHELMCVHVCVNYVDYTRCYSNWIAHKLSFLLRYSIDWSTFYKHPIHHRPTIALMLFISLLSSIQFGLIKLNGLQITTTITRFLSQLPPAQREFNTVCSTASKTLPGRSIKFRRQLLPAKQ